MPKRKPKVIKKPEPKKDLNKEYQLPKGIDKIDKIIVGDNKGNVKEDKA